MGEQTQTDNLHNKPIEVRECDGPTYAVAISEIFDDGSKDTSHYTEEQAEQIHEELGEIL